VISEAEYVERLAVAGDDEPEMQAEMEARYAIWSRGLALFNLAPTDYRLDDARRVSAAEVAAAYFDEEKDIVIIDRGRPLDDDDAVILFAHEIVHALQDRERDLAEYERSADSFDASLALDGIIEGEAVHYQLLVSLLLSNLDPYQADWEGYYTRWQADTFLDAEADEAPVSLAHVRFPYAFGGGFVTQHWLARGRGGIERLFEQPPRTTSEILFGTNSGSLEMAREALHDQALPELPVPIVEETSSSLGAWIARMYAARQEVDLQQRLPPARELSADYFAVQRAEDSDGLVASWRVRMSSESAARSWPRQPSLSRGGEIQKRDVLQIAFEGEPEYAVEELTWRAPTESAPDSEEADMTGLAWWTAAGPRHRACPLLRTERK
jgi:hypothetical protein